MTNKHGLSGRTCGATPPGNTGSLGAAFLGACGKITAAEANAQYAERAAKKLAAKPRSTPKANQILADSQVLEARALHEFQNYTLDQLCSLYSVPAQYMSRILDYTTRSKLIPKPSDATNGN